MVASTIWQCVPKRALEHSASIMSDPEKNVPAEGDGDTGMKVVTAEAEEVEEYAASALDEIFGSINDALGAQISSAFDGGGDDEGGPDVDVLTLLFVLIISKIGISFSVGIDWSVFDTAFGWLNRLSILAPHVPDVGETTIKTVTFVLLLLVQPVCFIRMKWLSREHRGELAPPLPRLLSWLPRVVRSRLVPCPSMFTPLTLALWLLFWVIFISAMATNAHMLAGFSCLFFGFPAAYLSFVNFSRQKTWEYVYLRCADVVRLRQYENLCLKEGCFVLFLFVASYSFVMNFFIALMSTWDSQTGVQNAFLVIGFIVYSVVPLWYLHHIITDVNADRTFRIFREQLVSSFVDQHMYMKLVLLVESVLFSLLVLLGSDATAQLVGGFVVSVIFFFVAVLSRPYEDDMENYSDLLARLTVCLTTMLGLIVVGSGSSTGVGVVLIIISTVTTIWFLYTMDIKEILLSRFFLLLQLYAQAKASRYTKSAIRKLPGDRVRRIADSPIEFHVLSAVQRIHFATLRKADFFGGKRIKELADLGVTWLDLQQMDFTCTSLRELGFTTEELMAVDAQLDDMGDRSDIQQLYEDAYNERKSAAGEFDRSTLGAMHALAALYKDMGEHVAGLDTATRCYKARAKHLGEDDEDTLVSEQFVGEYYVFLSRAGDGVELLRKCYETRKKTDPESEATLDCMRALGKALQGVKLSGEALTILEERYVTIVRQTMANKMRRDHPCTLPCRLDYANALADCGCFTSVPDLKLASILNRQKTIYGADHPTSLKLMDEYAALLTKMGALNPACQQLQECVSEKAATLGPNHTGTIASKFALAACLLELGRAMEMERLGLEACLADQETRLGETHPSTVSSMVKLAALYTTMNKHKEALELFKTCHAVRCKSLGRDHELTLGVANNIAATYDALSQFKEGRELYEKTLATSQQRFGKAHLSSTTVMINLALLYQRTGNLPKARQLYQELLALAVEAYGEKHPRSLMALDYIGCVDLVENKFAEAKQIFERCMTLKKEVYEETHPLCLTGLENLATAMQRLGQKAEAVEIYRRVVALRTAGYGAKHIETIKVRAAMAIVIAELGNQQEALATMSACINDTAAILGPASANVQEYIGVVGYMYAIYGQFDEGIRLTNQALAGTIKIYGENHFLVKGLLERKAWMLTSAGRTADAAKVTAIINALPSDGSAPAAPAAPAAAPAAQQNAAGPAGPAAAGASVSAAAGAVEETLSPLQQQLMAEQASDQAMEAQVAAKLQQVVQLLQAGQMAAALPHIQSFLSSDLQRVRQTQTILLAVNIAALSFNAQQPQVALAVMSAVYPIIEANFSSYREVLLPSMDMMGKALAYSGNVPGAIPILEEYIRQARQDLKPGVPNPTLQQTETLIVQLYGSQKQFDKAIALYTAQFEFYRDTEGEASEAAITAINSRAMYWFALKNFEKSRADHKEVIRLLILLQGEEHPETIQSLEGFKTLYAQHGMQY